MFLHVTGSLAAIAKAISVKSPQSIADWRNGTKTPSPDYRAAIEGAFGIPARAWSLRAGTAADAPPGDAEPADPSAPPPSTLEDCLALLATIRRDRQQAGLMASERVKLADAEARILALRARLESATELSEDRYVRDHPSWRRLEDAIIAALEPHPAAAKAVRDAIESAWRDEQQSLRSLNP
jgi:transcriptional regulator with XRE-family HTH domain